MRDIKNLFMKQKNLAAAIFICLCSQWVLCGCTKKEELILLTQDAAEQTEISGLSVESADTTETDESTGQAMRQDIAESAGDFGEASGADYIAEESGTIYVHVCGAVAAPGVYELDAGSRVYEAVQAAGGFTENAEESYVNQAQELPDGAKLVIPTVEEAERVRQEEAVGQPSTDDGGQIGIVAQGSVDTSEAVTGQEKEAGRTDDGRININTASVEELCEIPGIGATRAAAIVSYREDHGGFESPEDIMKVSGIKEGTYEKIKNSINVK